MVALAPNTETLRPAGHAGDTPPPVAQPATALMSHPDEAVAGQGEFMVRHDGLSSALVALEAAPAGVRGAERFALAIAARLCGWSGQGDLLIWARRRVAAYHACMAQAVREMLTAISVNNSLPRAIGEGV